MVGIDEAEEGPYFARLDPTTGNCTAQTFVGKRYTMGTGVSATLDDSRSTLYAVFAPAHGGNNFTLFSFAADTGELRAPPIDLAPTPDTTSPNGLAFHAGQLLAFLPAVTNGVVGGWELVSINPQTGTVKPTAGMRGLPEQHALISGAGLLLPHGPGDSCFYARVRG